MKWFVRISMLVLLLVAVGCGEANAQFGPDAEFGTISGTRTFFVIQDHLEFTYYKESFVISPDDECEVTAWRYTGPETWTQVFPDPNNAASDSVAICPAGYVLPIKGQFDAITVKATGAGGDLFIHTYK